MGIEYAKVMTTLDVPFTTIGRGSVNASKFKEETNNDVILGGLDQFLSTNPTLPTSTIVAVGIEALAETTIKLLEYGVTDILVEKPGIGYPAEINEVVEMASKKGAKVLLAYNRRFYSSVQKAKEIILEDGGVTSFTFEFTEWSHVIGSLEKTRVEHNTWFLGNSTHVIDTAFYLCGKPKQLAAFHKGGIDWHPAASVFSGAGISENGALFSYHANWEAPGRWVLEILTNKHRLVFKPMESLQIQKIGSIALEPV
jgi:predicted dehydrogenase